MPRSSLLFEALTTYYGNLAFDALSALRATDEDLRSGNFTLSRVSERVFSLWLESVEGWWSALLVNAGAPVPTLMVCIGSADQTRSATVHVRVPGTGQPQVTDLVRLAGGGMIPAAGHVRVEASKERDAVVLALRNLQGLRRKAPIAPGLYQGLVYIDERALAIVMAQVEAEPRSAAGREKVRR